MATVKINSGTGSPVTINKPGAPSTVGINRQPEAPQALRIMQYQNGTNYNAWGNAVEHEVDGIVVKDYFYSSTTHHLGKASSRRLRVSQYGTFIEDVEIYSNSLISRRDFGGGISSSGTIIIFYVENTYDELGEFVAQSGMGFYRSTDGFTTYTDYPDSMPLGDNTAYANFGSILEHPITGRLYHTAYGVSPLGRLITSYSDDDGLTWTFLSKTGSATQYSEGDMVFLDGTTNANAVLGYFVRNDVGKLGYFYSTNGGSTFTFLEEVAWSSGKSIAPKTFKRPDNGNIVLIYTDRSSFNYVIRAAELDPAILAAGGAGATANALLKFKTLWESFINSRPFESSNLPANFGYASPCIFGVDPSMWSVFLYDMSPNAVEPWSDGHDPVQCDTVMIPYESEVRVKARSTTNKSFANDATTQLDMEDTAMDSHGAWIDGEFIAPVSDTYEVCYNLPITNTNGGTKTFTVTKNDVQIHEYIETAGLVSSAGKLQGSFSVEMEVGDILKFFVNVTGATGSVACNCANTPTVGLFHTIDITNAPVKDIRLKINPYVQLFSNGVATKVEGTAAEDTHSAWDNNQFTVPRTAHYRIKFILRLPNAGGGRRLINVYNYEVGQEGQETRRKRLYSMEDKAGAGTNTDSVMIFPYKLNQGEIVKFWLTASGASLTSVAGDFYSIQIDEI